MRNRVLIYSFGLAVVVAYVVAAQLGGWFSNGRYVTLLWPAGGLGATLILLGGWRFWPAIACGAFIGGWTVGSASATSLWSGIVPAAILAVAETVQAVTIGVLARALGCGRNCFERPQAVLKFSGLAVTATVIGPTLTIAGLSLTGFRPDLVSLAQWLRWWAGDAVSCAVIVPMLVTWWNNPSPPYSLRRKAELCAALGVLILVQESVSSGFLINNHDAPMLNFLVIPVLLWAALRFGEHGASTSVFVLACVRYARVAQGPDLLAHPEGNQTLLILHGFMGVVASMACTLGADATQRQRAQANHAASEQRYRDLTADLEQRVKDRTRQLEAINKELEAFSYSVSHDLRAPLRSIRGFSEVLLERYGESLDARGQEFLQRACKSCAHMDKLIDDLLKLSRVGGGELQPARVNLSQVAESIAGELTRAHPEQQVQFTAEPGLMALGDERLLRVALENLLRNAWKFTGKKQEPRVEFGRATQPEKAFFVRDNGAGFDMRYAGKLFGVFQRLHTTSEFPGTGIGLATVQRIINRHGGRAWAAGTVNQGATIYFTLPTPEESHGTAA